MKISHIEQAIQKLEHDRAIIDAAIETLKLMRPKASVKKLRAVKPSEDRSA